MRNCPNCGSENTLPVYDDPVPSRSGYHNTKACSLHLCDPQIGVVCLRCGAGSFFDGGTTNIDALEQIFMFG